MRKTLLGSVLLLIVTLGGPLAAAEATFITPDRLDLTKLLAPAPAPDSAQQKRDLAAVLATQNIRTKAEGDRALADATAGTFGFADVLGSNFTAERVPAVAALFTKIRGDAAVAFSAGKDAWNRPRPFVVSPEVNPLGERPGGSSYPSGSSTAGYLTAIILADMVPEKAAALYDRGREFGDERVILGVHFPSDIEAGRFAATALAAALMEDAAFMKEFTAAKSELRQALGLSGGR
jgi:acid phosphatase (class A)